MDSQETMPFAKLPFLPPIPFSPVLSHPCTRLVPLWVLFVLTFPLYSVSVEMQAPMCSRKPLVIDTLSSVPLISLVLSCVLFSILCIAMGRSLLPVLHENRFFCRGRRMQWPTRLLCLLLLFLTTGGYQCWRTAKKRPSPWPSVESRARGRTAWRTWRKPSLRTSSGSQAMMSAATAARQVFAPRLEPLVKHPFSSCRI